MNTLTYIGIVPRALFGFILLVGKLAYIGIKAMFSPVSAQIEFEEIEWKHFLRCIREGL